MKQMNKNALCLLVGFLVTSVPAFSDETDKQATYKQKTYVVPSEHQVPDANRQVLIEQDTTISDELGVEFSEANSSNVVFILWWTTAVDAKQHPIKDGYQSFKFYNSTHLKLSKSAYPNIFNISEDDSSGAQSESKLVFIGGIPHLMSVSKYENILLEWASELLQPKDSDEGPLVTMIDAISALLNQPPSSDVDMEDRNSMQKYVSAVFEGFFKDHPYDTQLVSLAKTAQEKPFDNAELVVENNAQLILQKYVMGAIGMGYMGQ